MPQKPRRKRVGTGIYRDRYGARCTTNARPHNTRRQTIGALSSANRKFRPGACFRYPTAIANTDDDPPRRKPGRPRSREPHLSLSTWLPVPVYDRLAQLAVKRGESVSELTKAILERAMASRRPDSSRR